MTGGGIINVGRGKKICGKIRLLGKENLVARERTRQDKPAGVPASLPATPLTVDLLLLILTIWNSLTDSLDRAVDLVCSLKEPLHHLCHCVHVDVRFGDDFLLDVVVQVISNISALLPGLVDV